MRKDLAEAQVLSPQACLVPAQQRKPSCASGCPLARLPVTTAMKTGMDNMSGILMRSPRNTSPTGPLLKDAHACTLMQFLLMQAAACCKC